MTYRWMDRFDYYNQKDWKRAHDEFHQAICYFILDYVKDQDEAMLIADNCFAKIYRPGHDFATFKSIRAFLYKAAKNESIDYLRKTERESEALRYLQTEADDKTWEEVCDGEHAVTTREEQLRREIAQLPDIQEKIITMSYYDNLGNTEIARQLNLAPQTVSNLKTKARATLEKKMRAYYKKNA